MLHGKRGIKEVCLVDSYKIVLGKGDPDSKIQILFVYPFAKMGHCSYISIPFLPPTTRDIFQISHYIVKQLKYIPNSLGSSPEVH